MIGYEKTNAKPFYDDPWNGGKYESKKTLLIIPYQKEKPLNVLFYTRIFRGKYLI